MYANETYIYSFFLLIPSIPIMPLKERLKNLRLKFVIGNLNLSILICGRLLECTARKKSKSSIRSTKILIQISGLQLQLLNCIILENKKNYA